MWIITIKTVKKLQEIVLQPPVTFLGTEIVFQQSKSSRE